MEFAKTRGIYIGNHASNLDTFLAMWLTPTGTVGIAKKEVIYLLFPNSCTPQVHIYVVGFKL
jgi:1-acyl-sn-glycerol-3-phosphate acyltransferase